MKRRLFNMLTVMSLLLCVATVVTWITSRRTFHSLSYATPEWNYSLGVRATGAYLEKMPNTPLDLAGWTKSNFDSDDGISAFHSSYRVLGFVYGEFDIGFDLLTIPPSTDKMHFLRLPYWFLIAVTLIFPALVFCRRASFILHPGLCPKCGYDLRATPDRCPECGKAPQSSRGTS